MVDESTLGLNLVFQFDTLDVGVQEEFEKFMHERGINESLALFIPEYAEYKEQKVGRIVPIMNQKWKLTGSYCPGICQVAKECQDVC